jgi:hypothetical protein
VPDAPVAVGALADDAHAAGGVGVEVAAVELGACRSEEDIVRDSNRRIYL